MVLIGTYQRPDGPSDEMKCAKCGETSVRNFAGISSRTGRKKFVNLMGRPWHGNTCPDCKREMERDRARLNGRRKEPKFIALKFQCPCGRSFELCRGSEVKAG